MRLATKSAPSAGDLEKSLTLYVTETDPSPIEKRSFGRWVVLALLVLALHLIALYFTPNLFRPAPPPPIEVQEIDPAKIAAVKNSWKQKGFLLSKDPEKPKTKTKAPENARYESDRNRTVEKETRARQTNVVPNVKGDPKGKDQQKKKTAAEKDARKIPLTNLSNFQGLPVPGKRPEENTEESRQRGNPGETGDQALRDRSLQEGAENMLNTVESVYYSFYARIYDQIGPLWQSILNERVSRHKPPTGDYTTRAEIVFDSDGNYRDTRILSSSGIEDFDTAIPAAWRKIPRFPNPPRGLIQSDGYIHMVWSFSVRIDDRMQWQYLPPERN
jgi:TonB family protein